MVVKLISKTSSYIRPIDVYCCFRTDDKGIICDQRSVFRVNCMDCLDRTNVVQAAIARQVMETQVYFRVFINAKVSSFTP